MLGAQFLRRPQCGLRGAANRAVGWCRLLRARWNGTCQRADRQHHEEEGHGATDHEARTRFLPVRCETPSTRLAMKAKRPAVPAGIIVRLRSICGRLPEAHEEAA